MEKALFISRSIPVDEAASSYQRIYFGSEFCQNLIPEPEELKSALDYCQKNNKGFTFVTPILSDKGMEKLKPMLSYISKEAPESEILINDWGLLYWLRKELNHQNCLIGRLLSQQRRDPRNSDLKKSLSAAAFNFFQKAMIESSFAEEYFKDHGIRRIELDNLTQGIIREAPLLKASLHLPFVFLSMTRFCPFQNKQRGARKIPRLGDCAKKCRNQTLRLKNKKIPFEIILKSNAYFFLNTRLPRNLEGLNIDRLVYSSHYLEKEQELCG